VRANSLNAINQTREAFSVFSQENQKQEAEYNSILELAQTMNDQGVTSNIYAQFTVEQVTERWNRLQAEVTERTSAIDNETTRLEENENICKEFAVKADDFTRFCEAQRVEITTSDGGDLQNQLDVIRTKIESLSTHKPELDSLSELNHKIDERNITHNPHTKETMETLTLTWERLNDFVSKHAGVLEKELLSQTGSKVSEEQLAEFKETFRQFDKDGSSNLEKHEFKACLSALGHFVNDDQLNNLFDSIAKKTPGKMQFEEFVDYMISKTEDSDTPATIKNAFKSLAGDKDFVTEEELRRVLDPDTVDYLLKNMPNDNGNFDYHTFTDNSYNKV